MNFIQQPTSKTYHYIIGGAGLAGLSLAYKLAKAGLLKNKSLLIIDADDKTKNDRTWSFWSDNVEHLTDFPIQQKWSHGIIKSNELSSRQKLVPYQYYSIEGLSYYEFVKEELTKYNSIDWLLADIQGEFMEKKQILTDVGSVNYSEYYFKNYFSANSILNEIKAKNDNFLWQHFLGWRIKLNKAVFDAEAITYMDMRVPQPKNGLAFIYILPYSEEEALVEYTLFSPELLDRTNYETSLKTYINKYITEGPYEMIAEEFNKIPMTSLIKEKVEQNCIPIGTIAGAVKASTGYSFVRNQQHTTAIVNAILKGKKPPAFSSSKRHTFYDKVLINVIGGGSESGEGVFSKLYEANQLSLLLKFLDEETTLLEELKIMTSVPKWSFTKAVFRQLFL